VSNPPQTHRPPSDIGSPRAGQIAGRFAVRVTADSHFGWLRTRASLERTLLSWIRTAVSLIGFGFTIVQFFHRVPELPGANPAYHPDAPWYLGLALIFCGRSPPHPNRYVRLCGRAAAFRVAAHVGHLIATSL
jgi:hypothetical protein